MKEPVVLSLGGSLIVPDSIDHQFLKNFRDTILKFIKRDWHFLIVTGGGKTARVYQDAAKKIGPIPQDDVDWIGIHSTHLNAHLLRTIFRDHAHLKILTHYSEKEDIPEPIVVAAGWKPGHSTDYDAVMFARLYGIKTVVNLSNIPFVYDKDPNEFPDAKPIEDIGWVDYRKIVGDVWIPGDTLPFDPIASKAAHKSGIRVIIADGKNLANFEAFLLDKPFRGTVIS
ncbi:UMP kinase [Patescibacteria group bacterium]|nr:UMP kinase [Patescibacteria group bacterium]